MARTNPTLTRTLLVLAVLCAGGVQAATLATALTNWDGVEIHLASVERKGSVLTVKWAVRNGGSAQQQVGFSLVGNGASTYVVDEESGTKYYALTDQENHLVASEHEYVDSGRFGIVANLDAGATKRYWAKFPAPPPEVKTVSLFFTETEPLEDVAITDKP